MRELVIADRQEITRLGIGQLASGVLGFQSIEEISNKKKLKAYLSNHAASIVVLDYQQFDFSNFEEFLVCVEMFKETDWVLFSDDFNDAILKQLIAEQDLFSVVLKTDSLFEIRAALTAATKREQYICERIADKISKLNRFSGKIDRILTNSEREILKEIASGKMTKVIALEKNLSIHTITTHRKNIFKKLEINNVHDAIRYAIRAGIIDMGDYTI